MRFLLEPCNNTLSHIAKCLAVRDCLQARGHEVFLAVAPSRVPFLDGLGVPHAVLADIQEADGGPSPSIASRRLPHLPSLLNQRRPSHRPVGCCSKVGIL